MKFQRVISPPHGGTEELQPISTPEPRKRPTRASISVSGPFFTKLENWCRLSGVPISAVVEILAARAIGMPLTELPKHIQKWVAQIPTVDAIG